MPNKITIKNFIYLLIILIALVLAVILFAQLDCPQQGWAFTTATRAFVSLKNRNLLPRSDDFDERVTLDALLEPGDDRDRWSEGRAARIEGYVVSVMRGGIEPANCYSLRMRDTHIYVARNSNAPSRERVVVEITPRLREWAGRFRLVGTSTGKRAGWPPVSHRGLDAVRPRACSGIGEPVAGRRTKLAGHGVGNSSGDQHYCTEVNAPVSAQKCCLITHSTRAPGSFSFAD